MDIDEPGSVFLFTSFLRQSTQYTTHHTFHQAYLAHKSSNVLPNALIELTAWFISFI